MPRTKKDNTQELLKEQNRNTVFQIPLILHEAERERSESREKRFVCIIIILIILIALTNLAWLIFASSKLGTSSDAVGNTDSIVVHGGDITLGHLN